MNESRFIPVDEIKSMKGAIRSTDIYLTLPRADVEALLSTAEQQAGQIQRLQEAVEYALYYSTEFTSDLISQGIITLEDML